MTPKIFQMRLEEALSGGEVPLGNLAVPVFSRGTLEVELYTPDKVDPQTPHDRDEAYVVARGSGVFFDGTERHRIEAGTFLFVAAGQPHRFEEFTDDFTTWVLFYGPEGGEEGGTP